MGPIADHITSNLLILFIGYNPSIRSGQSGHHYANPNNRFWSILYQSGLTPKKFKAEEDSELLKIGYGFTNIVARPTKTAAEITREEYTVGRCILKEKLESYKPKIACFVGKGVYEQFSGKRNISWGVQNDPIVTDVIEFVAPSSSGLVRMKIDEFVKIYNELHQTLNSFFVHCDKHKYIGLPISFSNKRRIEEDPKHNNHS